ncbi:MAG: hypothetical protein WC091_09580 [Sulfuricellaceae bacterium]
MEKHINVSDFREMVAEIALLRPRLTNQETEIVDVEIRAMRALFAKGDFVTLAEIQRSVKSGVKGWITGHELLNRTHHLSGKGCLASNLGICTFSDTLVKNGLSLSTGAKFPLIVSQGHLAPAFYVARFLYDSFPLSFLYTLHSVLPGVVTEKWGFCNSLNRPLGVGLSDCVGRAMSEWLSGGDKKTYNCLVGDGELQEGISFELLSLISKYRLPINVILNKNGFGIGSIDDGMDYVSLSKALNFQVDAICGEDAPTILETYERINADNSSVPRLVILSTTKGIRHFDQTSGCTLTNSRHSFSASKIGENRGSHIMGSAMCEKLSGVPHTIVSPDLAQRFGLHTVRVINTGVRENSSILMFLGFPEGHKKIIATDDQFFSYGLGAIEQLVTADVRNLWIVASKNWGIWNGGNFFINQALEFDGLVLLEPHSKTEINACLDFGVRTELNIVFSVFDSDFTDHEPAFPMDLFKLNPVRVMHGKIKAVVMFGFAGRYLVDLMLLDADSDYFYVNSFPIPREEIEKLNRYEDVVFVEFNRSRSGVFSRFLPYLFGIRTKLIGADETFLFRPENQQISHQGLDLRSILSAVSS